MLMKFQLGAVAYKQEKTMEADVFNFMTGTISKDWLALFLRLVVGLALLPYGIKKFAGRAEADKFLHVKIGKISFPPSVAYYMAMTIELLAPVCMILGFFTRLAAIPAICNMAVASQESKGPYLTTPASPYLLGFVAILVAGPGKFSLDWLMF